MKKLTTVLLVFVILSGLALPATAAEFSLDEYARVEGMGCSWYQGYQPSIKNHTMTLYLPLRAASCVGEITVSLALDDPHVYLLSAEPKAARVSPREGLYPVKLTLPLEKGRRNGDFPATITVTGRDGAGQEISETFSYIIRIRDGAPSHETLEPVITLAESSLDVGGSGMVTLQITNPTTTLSLTGGVLRLTDPSGDVLLAQTDRITLPEVLPGRTETLQIPVTVSGHASVSIHSFQLELSGTVADQPWAWSWQLRMPVTQTIRLEQGGVDLPSAIAGELDTLTLPLMNMGKGELHNVLVKLEMPEALDAQSVLLGTLAPGETKQAKLTFSPFRTALGDYSGTVTVTCEDAWGSTFTQTLSVTLEVEAPIPQEVLAQEEEPARISPWTVVLITACILLTAALLIQGLLLTGKLHKLEEERL